MADRAASYSQRFGKSGSVWDQSQAVGLTAEQEQKLGFERNAQSMRGRIVEQRFAVCVCGEAFRIRRE